MTNEVRLSRLQQQIYNDENKAVSATHSQKLDVVLQQLQEAKRELTDTKRKLENTESLLADANEKNRQLEAERKKNAKERKDLVNEIALLRSDLYSGTKSQQSGRSAEEVGVNNVITLKGVTIGDKCVIGAGCLVYKHVAAGSMKINKQELVIK